jgi:hypothetical protein
MFLGALMLTNWALDWRQAQPRLVPYIGRVERGEKSFALISPSATGDAAVPHELVFWLGAAAPRGDEFHRIVWQVGHA